MSGISGVSSISYTNYSSIASGKKVQSAADGATELAMIEKEETQARGYNAGAENISSAQNLLNVSDGALGGITDYLQRIRELALKASNGLLSDSDKSSIQTEIDQLKEGISDIVSGTTYNTKNLLDGTNTEFSLATDSNGTSMTVNTGNAALEALGIADFDVTGDFDISDIDNALSLVNSLRSSAGAQSNALTYAYNYNTNAFLNATAAKSSLEDLDIPGAVSDLKKNQLLEEYTIMMQKKQMDDEETKMRSLFV